MTGRYVPFLGQLLDEEEILLAEAADAERRTPAPGDPRRQRARNGT
jgi:hypothetical protein